MFLSAWQEHQLKIILFVTILNAIVDVMVDGLINGGIGAYLGGPVGTVGAVGASKFR